MISVQCSAITAGLDLRFDDSPIVLGVSGWTEEHPSIAEAVEVTLTQRQVAALTVAAASLDPETWRVALFEEFALAEKERRSETR